MAKAAAAATLRREKLAETASIDTDDIDALAKTVEQSIAEARGWLVDAGNAEPDGKAALSACLP